MIYKYPAFYNDFSFKSNIVLIIDFKTVKKILINARLTLFKIGFIKPGFDFLNYKNFTPIKDQNLMRHNVW